jgi:predicted DCC family thiol-disulfide oxidoreductase YuxK
VNKPLVLYDGYCVLCNRSVQFLQDRQLPGAIEYASQQSERGQAALKQCGLSTQDTDMLVAILNARCYVRSSAVLRVFRFLRFPWPVLYGLILVPRFIRDPIYDLIAHNRYRWFGHMPRE